MLYSNINNSKFNFEMRHPILDIDEQKYSHMFDLSIESDILNIPYKNNYLKFLGKKRDISYTFTEKQIYEGVIEVFSSEIEKELNKKNRENTICEEEDEEIFFNENSNKSLIIGEYKKESDNTSEKIRLNHIQTLNQTISIGN
jgi:predicted transcriptional regulator